MCVVWVWYGCDVPNIEVMWCDLNAMRYETCVIEALTSVRF